MYTDYSTSPKKSKTKKMTFNYLKNKHLSVFVSFALILFSGCKKDFTNNSIQSQSNSSLQLTQSRKPNIILFIADDYGYELPTYTGGQSYYTPNQDLMAANGTQFSEAYCHPDGYPSRLALYTGKYNFRNYTVWGQLPVGEKTIGNMLHDAGYATCFVGKWNCDGGDSRIVSAGFDKYRVFLPFAKSNEDFKYQYKDPKLYESGNFLPSSQTQGQYSEDMYVDYLSKFIDSNKTNPFFSVYAFNLPRTPWAPTPDDPDYATWSSDSVTDARGNIKYFPGMVNYLDKSLGKIMKKINDAGLQNNTIFLFTSDNPTNRAVTSLWNGIQQKGTKNFTTLAGTHVPFVAYGPGLVASGVNTAAMVDYTDFLPSLAGIAGIPVPTNYGILDGTTFYDELTATNGPDRSHIFCSWDNSQKDNKPEVRYVHDLNYKLYDFNNYANFFNVKKDPKERKPLVDSTLTPIELAEKLNFEAVLQSMHN